MTTNDDLKESIADQFFSRASMTTQDQPDGGDTWHISKKEFNAYADALMHLFQQQVEEIEKAYGGCRKCYGKGYATVRAGTTGYDDFGGDGFKTPPTTKVKFCVCDRGEQLRERLKKLEEK